MPKPRTIPFKAGVLRDGFNAFKSRSEEAMFTADEVKVIWSEWERGDQPKDIAERWGCGLSTVNKICKNAMSYAPRFVNDPWNYGGWHPDMGPRDDTPEVTDDT